MSPSNQTFDISSDNHNVSLSCKTNGTISYIWDRKKGGIPSRSIGKRTSTLTLINVQPRDSGNYQCVATNSYGASLSDYATIIIKGI